MDDSSIDRPLPPTQVLEWPLGWPGRGDATAHFLWPADLFPEQGDASDGDYTGPALSRVERRGRGAYGVLGVAVAGPGAGGPFQEGLWAMPDHMRVGGSLEGVARCGDRNRTHSRPHLFSGPQVPESPTGHTLVGKGHTRSALGCLRCIWVLGGPVRFPVWEPPKGAHQVF